ncbi:MAG: hypothetical protein ACRCXZ_02920 [Patescibacteria group bacterium]
MLHLTQVELDPATVAMLNYFDCIDTIDLIQEFVIRAYHFHNDHSVPPKLDPFPFSLVDSNIPLLQSSRLEQDYLNFQMYPEPQAIGANTQIYAMHSSLILTSPEVVSENIINFIEIDESAKSNRSRNKTKFFAIPSSTEMINILDKVFAMTSTNQISLLGQFNSFRMSARFIKNYRSIYHDQPSVSELMNIYLGFLINA